MIYSVITKKKGVPLSRIISRILPNPTHTIHYCSIKRITNTLDFVHTPRLHKHRTPHFSHNTNTKRCSSSQSCSSRHLSRCSSSSSSRSSSSSSSHSSSSSRCLCSSSSSISRWVPLPAHPCRLPLRASPSTTPTTSSPRRDRAAASPPPCPHS